MNALYSLSWSIPVKSASPLIRAIEQFLDRHAISLDRMIVAVSGGPDSMALLCALAALRARKLHPGEARDSILVVAHLNHKLRGQESDGDEAFVRQFHESMNAADRLGLELRCESVDIANLARVKGANVESIARRARYDWLTRLARDLSIPFVATGHTADDQAETVLHHLLRGTGLRGLSGIAPRHVLTAGVEVVRPMLHLRRGEVLAYLEEERQPYRSDSSNSDLKFTRNRIRHALLPHLADCYNPAIVSLLGQLASQASEAATELEAAAQAILAQAELPKAGNRVVLDKPRLALFPRHHVREVFRSVWHREGWPMGEMGFPEWDIMAGLALGESAAIDLPGGIRAVTRERVVLCGPAS